MVSPFESRLTQCILRHCTYAVVAALGTTSESLQGVARSFKSGCRAKSADSYLRMLKQKMPGRA